MNGVSTNYKRLNETQIVHSAKKRKVVPIQQLVRQTIPQGELILGPDIEIKTEFDSSDEIDIKPCIDVTNVTKNHGTNDLDSIMQELKYLRKTVQEIKNCCTELSATVMHLLKRDTMDADDTIAFPAKTKAELELLDRQIEDNPDKYNMLFKRMAIGCRGKLEKTLKNIISTELALAYNFDGTHGMLPFKNFKNINTCLFNATKSEVPSTQLYKQAVQQGFRRMKNLHFKRLSNQRKMNEEAIDYELVLDEDIISVE